MSAIYVEIIATRGSAPRDAGTAMKVTQTGSEGTIGGGALEHRAIETARFMLATQAPGHEQTIPLGPGLGQCCGGAVTLRFTRERREVDAVRAVQRIGARADHPRELWLWGAGHVGRAVVRACDPRTFRITWIDSGAERFPTGIGDHVRVVTAADMPCLANSAPTQANHLIFTYSHEIDLALCAALLRRGFASCGLIGSDTKWARFSRRLRAAGLDPGRITCPIGDKRLGKHPDAIAEGTVAALLPERMPV